MNIPSDESLMEPNVKSPGRIGLSTDLRQTQKGFYFEDLNIRCGETQERGRNTGVTV